MKKLLASALLALIFAGAYGGIVNISGSRLVVSDEGGGEDPGGGDSDDITAALTVEYVDSNGDRVRTDIGEGESKSITCVAPCIVHFDATATRSVAEDGDDEAGAFYNIGYRFSFGEGIGGTWDYPEFADPDDRPSRDEDIGPPITQYVYTVPGTYTTRMKVRDSLDNEDSVSFTANIQDPGAGTDISVGSCWPTWQDNTTYNLDGDYTACGTITTSGRRNVLIRKKPGAESTPIVSAWRIEGRGPINSSSVYTRSAAVRLYEVDVGFVDYTDAGIDYCGVVKGRARIVDADPSEASNYNHANTDTQVERENFRYSRGLTFWDTGEMNARPPSGYVIFSSPIRAFHMRNVWVHKETGVNNVHAIRGIFSHSSFRSLLISNTGASSSYVKIYGDSANETYPEGTAWRDDDRVGTITGTKVRYIYPTHKVVLTHSQMGKADDTLPTSNVGCGPQTNTLPAASEALELCTFEDLVWYRSGSVSTGDQDAEMSGRNMGLRNLKKDMGAGDEVSKQTAVHTNTAVWLDGPYIVESTNSRPVPSAFD